MNDKSAHGLDLIVVVPCLNDSLSLSKLVPELSLVFKESRQEVRIIICDDGSTDDEIKSLRKLAGDNSELILLIGGFKSGHQSAILRGLQEIEKRFSPVPDLVIMDADGEDNPVHAKLLIDRLRNSTAKAVLAKRGVRHSGTKFIFMHKLFNIPFKLLTGKKLETGNFMSIKGDWLNTLLKLPSITNHVSTTVIRYAPEIEKITLDRNARYYGKSRMNLSSLSLHGYGALAVYAELVLSRIIIGTSILALFLGSIAFSLVGLKLFSSAQFLPGWTSNAVIQILSLTLITIFQAVTTTILILWTKKT
jgi:glycosyltransferase involved in cell wall biosynthesis